MNRGFKKAAVIALSSCLAMTALAGCSKKEAEFDTAVTALTVNDTTASAGLVKFICHYTQASVEDFYNMYFGENAFSMSLDESGTTIGDMTRDGAVKELTKMFLAEQNMEAYGVSLTDEEKAAITAAAEAFIAANDAETMTLMSADQANVERYLELCTIQNKMEAAMGEDVDTVVSDEEAAQRKIQYVLITAETEAEEAETEAAATEAVETEAAEATTEAAETEAAEATTEAAETEAAEAVTEAVETEATEAVTEAETAALEANDAEKTESAEETEAESEDPAMTAAKEEAFAKAEKLIEMLKNGEEFETAALAIDEELTVNDQSFGAEDTSVNADFITATEGLEDGAIVETPIEAASGYYVVKLVTQLDREATDARKEEIIEERRTELVANLYTEWEAAAEVTQDDKAISQIVFDFALTLETETETEAGTEASTEAVTEAGTEVSTEAVTE